MDITDLMKIPAKNRKLILHVSRHLAQNKTFSGVIQNRKILSANLIENTLRQTPEAEYIDIENPFALRLSHQIPLRLHRELIRNNHKEVSVFLLLCLHYDMLIQKMTLS